jgi:N-acetylmuramoyl-L-alanine amidase
MYKIFLSPSNQFENKYAGMYTSEGEQMGKVAQALQKALERCGFGVLKIHDATMQAKVHAADQYGADLYIPIHSNAYNGKVSGTRMFCWSKKEVGYYACCNIAAHLFPLTPGTSESITEAPDLYEVRMPTAPTVYIEVDFHDVEEVARWIVDHIDEIAEAICKGVCDHFGVPYVEPKPEKLYRVQVGAFRNRENAEHLLKKLKVDYPDAFIKED